MKRYLLTFLCLSFLLILLGASSPKNLSIEVLNPRGEIEHPKVSALSPRIPDLAGKTIGLYDNGKPNVQTFQDAFEELLKKRFPTVKVIRLKGPFEIMDSEAKAWAKEIDAFVYAWGD